MPKSDEGSGSRAPASKGASGGAEVEGRGRDRPDSHVRRRDRAVTDDGWIRHALEHAAVGHLATVQDGQPFVNVNLFVYDEPRHAIYLHTAGRGRTRSNVEAAAKACFEISEMGRLLPAAEALEFSVEYAGVVVFGDARVVDDPEEAEWALQRLLDKYAPHLRPGTDYRPIQPDELRRTAVYRIDVREWSGKRKVVPEDFPGAFAYRAPSLLEAVPTPHAAAEPAED